MIADLASGNDGPSLFRIGGSAGVIGRDDLLPAAERDHAGPVQLHLRDPRRRLDRQRELHDVDHLGRHHAELLPRHRDQHDAQRPRQRAELRPGARVGDDPEHPRNRSLRRRPRLQRRGRRHLGERCLQQRLLGASPLGRTSHRLAPRWTRGPARTAPASSLGDLEWDQFHKITLSDYQVGIHVVAGQRAQFTGSFLQPDIRRTDDRPQGRRDGRPVGTHARRRPRRRQRPGDPEQLARLREDHRHRTRRARTPAPSTRCPAPHRPTPRSRSPDRRAEACTSSNAPHGVGYLPAADATSAVQKTLDKAGREGGGIVYLPAGLVPDQHAPERSREASSCAGHPQYRTAIRAARAAARCCRPSRDGRPPLPTRRPRS